MAPQALALLLALCWAAAAAPLQDVCEQELNKIKDLLQVSCVDRGLTGPPAGLPLDTGILLLSANRLSQLSLAAFGQLRNLTDLDLANNSLAALQPDAPLPALQQLSLAHNALQSLPVLRGLPGLRRLALGHNALAQLPDGGFRALPRLQDLELQGNRLRRLAPGAFAGLAELRDLDLSDNALEALPQALLAGLEALQILRLERNLLQSVPDGFFGDNLFAYVYLRGNPWRCDCRLRYLRDWIDENEISVYTRLRGLEKETTEHDPKGVVCSAPPEHKGSPVMSFQATCRDLGDGEGGAHEEGDPRSPSTSAVAPSSSPPLPSVPARPSRAAPPPLSSRALPSVPARPSTTAPPPPSSPPSPSTPARPYGLPTAVSTSAASLPAHTPTSFPTTQGTASPPGTPRTSEPPCRGEPGLLQTTPTVKAATTPAPGRPGPTELSSCCPCPAVQVGALQAPTRHRSPAPRASRLAVLCCLLRLALYAASLALVSLPLLLGGCYWAWAGLSGRLRAPPESPPAGRRQLQRGATSGAGSRLYYVCKEFQLAPARHVAWLLISLPGPAGRRRCGRGPSSDSAGAASAL